MCEQLLESRYLSLLFTLCSLYSGSTRFWYFVDRKRKIIKFISPEDDFSTEMKLEKSHDSLIIADQFLTRNLESIPRRAPITNYYFPTRKICSFLELNYEVVRNVCARTFWNVFFYNFFLVHFSSIPICELTSVHFVLFESALKTLS
jgi:hypothetical protein